MLKSMQPPVHKHRGPAEKSGWTLCVQFNSPAWALQRLQGSTSLVCGAAPLFFLLSLGCLQGCFSHFSVPSLPWSVLSFLNYAVLEVSSAWLRGSAGMLWSCLCPAWGSPDLSSQSLVHLDTCDQHKWYWMSAIWSPWSWGVHITFMPSFKSQLFQL